MQPDKLSPNASFKSYKKYKRKGIKLMRKILKEIKKSILENSDNIYYAINSMHGRDVYLNI